MHTISRLDSYHLIVHASKEVRKLPRDDSTVFCSSVMKNRLNLKSTRVLFRNSTFPFYRVPFYCCTWLTKRKIHLPKSPGALLHNLSKIDRKL